MNVETQAQSSNSVSVRSVLPVVRRLERLGFASSVLSSELDICLERVNNLNAFLSPDEARRAWSQAEQLTSDPEFGLHAALESQPNLHDVMEIAFRCAPNLGEAMRRMVLHRNFLHDAAIFFLEYTSNHFSIVHQLPNGHRLPAGPAQYMVASWLCLARRSTGHELSPVAVHLPFCAPAKIDEYRLFFRAPITFDAVESRLVFERDACELPLLQPDASDVGILRRHLEGAELPPSLAAPAHKGGAAGLLNLCLSSLPNQALPDSGLRDLARKYASDPEIASREIGFLLGFSSWQAFERSALRSAPAARTAGSASQDIASPTVGRASQEIG